MGNANETPPQSAFDQRLADLTPAIADAVFALSAFADTASRNERRKGYWRMAMYTVISLMLLFAVIMNLHNLRRMWGPNSEPAAESIALISINGGIGQKDNASAESVIPLIEQACRAERVTEVVLLIDSPGGSPTDADRIVSALKLCKEAGRPVVSVIGSMGASAAYMVAMHSDRIYASRYSLVGSIGAITRHVDASGLAKRLGLVEQVYKSGHLKGGPSALSGSSQKDSELMSELVVQVAGQFYGQLQAARGPKLKGEREQLLSGRIWTAQDALALGLVDEIAVLEDLKMTRFKGKQFLQYRAKSSFMTDMGLTAEAVSRSFVAGAKQGAFE